MLAQVLGQDAVLSGFPSAFVPQVDKRHLSLGNNENGLPINKTNNLADKKRGTAIGG
jgi:hypothetical protein